MGVNTNPNHLFRSRKYLMLNIVFMKVCYPLLFILALIKKNWVTTGLSAIYHFSLNLLNALSKLALQIIFRQMPYSILFSLPNVLQMFW